MEHYSKTLADFDALHPGGEWLSKQRQIGRQAFLDKGFPTMRDEDWKYTSLRKVAEKNFETAPFDAVLPANAVLEDYFSDEDVGVVFVDGVYSAELSRLSRLPGEVKVQNLEEVLDERPEVVREFLQCDFPKSSGPFGHLNRGMTRTGIFIEVSESAVIDFPFYIVYVSSTKTSPCLTSSQNILSVGRSAKVNFVEMYLSESKELLNNVRTQVLARADSEVGLYRVQNEGDASYHVSNVTLQLERDSRLSALTCTANSYWSRHNLDVELLESGAQLELNGCYLLRPGQHVDHHTAIEHRVPHCQSSQLYKGVLSERSRAVFNGKVVVARNAFGTNAFQLNKNLILGEQAEVDTKPELQIDNDDVKCSHGATIGQLNQDELFYLRSRGIQEGVAEAMLCRAYVEDLIEGIKVEGVAKKLTKMLDSYFSRGSES